MTQTSANSKMTDLLYRAVLPGLTVAMLLGVASFNDRTRIIQWIPADFVIRLLLSLWFCGLYIRISRISTYSIYPNIKWSKADVGKLEKYYLWALCLFFGIGVGIITFWVIQWFLPEFSPFAYGFAAINSLLIMVPILKNYWVLKG